MRKILFTSNFKNFPIAFCIALFAITCIEVGNYRKFTEKYFNHEVDHLLNTIEKHPFAAEYLLIGDSVGLQLFEQFRKDTRFAVLATNQAVEVTGQFFITKRYLNNNKKPLAIIYVTLPYYNHNLEQIYTENFVYRPFNLFDEILTIVKVKIDPSIFIKMLSYKFLPSFKYRLKIQEDFIGFTNSDIYSGIDSAIKPAKKGEYSILKTLNNKIHSNTTSRVHFKDFVDYIASLDIDFYYIPAPIKKSPNNRRSSHQIQHQKLIDVNFPALKRLYPHKFFYDQELLLHNPLFFGDPVHYNQKGLPYGEKFIKDKVDAIISKYGDS